MFQAPVLNIIKLFTAVNYEARPFVRGKLFHSSLKFASKTESFSQEGRNWKLLNLGRLLALPTNKRLGRKGLPGTNSVAYYELS